MATTRSSRRSRFEDDEDEAPRRNRRRSLDQGDDDDQEPRQSRRRNRRDQDDDEDEPRAKKSNRRRRSLNDDDDAEEDERPARSRRNRRSGDDDEDESPRRRSRNRRQSDDEEDERPARSRRNGARQSGASGGWDGLGGGGGDYEARNALKIVISKKAQIVKVLQDTPFDSFHSHWIHEIKSGKRSFRGLAEDCPLCDDLGYDARRTAYFNVALWDSEEGEWVPKVWEVGVKVGRELQEIAEDKKRGPLTKPDLYIAISKSGKGLNTEYAVERVKARDLDEDWDVDELGEDQIEELLTSAYDEAWEPHSTRAELERVVDRVLEADEDDD